MSRSKRTATNTNRWIPRVYSRRSIKGRLHHNEWTDNDGNRRETLEVIADEIHGLARPNSAGKPDAESDVQIDVADFEPAPPADDDIPF